MFSWEYALANHECMNGLCNACPGTTPIAEICKNLEKVESLTFYKWTTKKVVCKISDEMFGEEAASMYVCMYVWMDACMHEFISPSLKNQNIKIYNIY